MNLALVAERDRIVLHTALCGEARDAADDGLPVMTMFGCEREPELEGLVRHECLDE